MCPLQDGHTNVSAPEKLYGSEFTVPPFRTRLIEGKVIITDVADASLSEQGIVRGGRNHACRWHRRQSLGAQNVAPHISASTPQDLDTVSLAHSSCLARAEQPQVEFKDASGKTWNAKAIERVSYGKRNQGIVRAGPFSWKMLEGNIAFVALNSFW